MALLAAIKDSSLMTGSIIASLTGFTSGTTGFCTGGSAFATGVTVGGGTEKGEAEAVGAAEIGVVEIFPPNRLAAGPGAGGGTLKVFWMDGATTG